MTSTEELIAHLQGEAAKIGELMAFAEKYREFLDGGGNHSLGSSRSCLYLHRIKDPVGLARAVGGKWIKKREFRHDGPEYDYEGESPDGLRIVIFGAEPCDEKPLSL